MFRDTRRALKKNIVRYLSHPRVCDLFDPFRRNLGAVFMMHRLEDKENGINGHKPEFLKEALIYLKKEKYDLVSVEELIDIMDQGVSPYRKVVAFTMDDGFLDQADIGIPIFNEFACPVTVFLATGFIDGILWPWEGQIDYIITNTKHRQINLNVGNGHYKIDIDVNTNSQCQINDLIWLFKQLPGDKILYALSQLAQKAEVDVPLKPTEAYLPMTWQQARDLESANIRFAPHSVSHAILAQLTDEQVEYEVTESWRRLNEELVNPLPVFAYPTGRKIDFGERELKLLQKYDFAGAVTSEAGYVDFSKDSPHDHQYRIRRYSMPDNMEDFIQYCSWIERAKQILRREKI